MDEVGEFWTVYIHKLRQHSSGICPLGQGEGARMWLSPDSPGGGAERTGSLSEMWLGHKHTHDRLIPSKLHNDFLRRAGSARAGWPQRRMRRSRCAQYARRAAHCAGRKPQPRLFPVPRVSRPSAESAVGNMGRVFHGLSEVGMFVTDRDEGADHDALPLNY